MSVNTLWHFQTRANPDHRTSQLGRVHNGDRQLSLMPWIRGLGSAPRTIHHIIVFSYGQDYWDVKCVSGLIHSALRQAFRRYVPRQHPEPFEVVMGNGHTRHEGSLLSASESSVPKNSVNSFINKLILFTPGSPAVNRQHLNRKRLALGAAE